MKKIILMSLVVLAGMSANADQISADVSTCIVRQKGQQNLELKLIAEPLDGEDPIYSVYSGTFQNIKIAFYPTTKMFEISRVKDNGSEQALASAHMVSLKQGESFDLSTFDTSTGDLIANVACKLRWSLK